MAPGQQTGQGQFHLVLFAQQYLPDRRNQLLNRGIHGAHTPVLVAFGLALRSYPSLDAD
jgi:hypothetical protein